MYAVETTNLTKTYGTRRGITDVNLQLEPGEVFGFLGPNGAGKSTTIRLLLGLIRPTSGEISIFGQSPHAAGPKLRREIGYLPGTFIVDGRQKVANLLDYFAALRGGVPRERITKLAQRLELDTSTEVRKLSKGNKQKLGIIQALMHRPKLLLLDEPTTGLDPLLQRVFLELVDEAKADGATVLMSSHVLAEVQHCADRVGVIREGQLIAVEKIEDVRAKAIRHIVATFGPPLAEDASAIAKYQSLPGVSSLAIADNRLECDYAGPIPQLMRLLLADGLVDILSTEPDLESIFFHYYDAPTVPEALAGRSSQTAVDNPVTSKEASHE